MKRWAGIKGEKTAAMWKIILNYSLEYNYLAVILMKINVPFLNALVAALHILIIGIALYCLKLASRPLKKFAGDVCVA